MFNPLFVVTFTLYALKVLAVVVFVGSFLLIYVLGIGVYVSTRRNYRKGKEYGSALWGIASVLNKKYMQHPKKNNKILTQNVNIGFNAKKHRRNLNVLVVGRKWCRKNKILCKA